MKVLMISTDALIFEPESGVHKRMLSYASGFEELFIVVLGVTHDLKIMGKLKYLGLTRGRALLWRPPIKFDLVTSQDPFETGMIARRLAKLVDAKLELQIHTDLFSPYFIKQSFKNWFRVQIAKFLLPRADYIRVVSQRIADSLQTKSYKLKANILIRPIVVDVEVIKNSPIKTDLHQKYPQFNKIVLMASRLTKEKNINLAIGAMKEVVKTNSKIGLIIVGSGPEKNSLKLKVESLKLDNNIIFEHWTDDLPSYYKTCNLFLLTSWYEGYGMTLVEARAAGCKIISTDVGVAREVGTIISSFDSRDLAAIILNVI